MIMFYKNYAMYAIFRGRLTRVGIWRRRHMQQHPVQLPDGTYLAGKSFVMGVALGISGVVASPVRGKQTY